MSNKLEFYDKVIAEPKSINLNLVQAYAKETIKRQWDLTGL